MQHMVQHTMHRTVRKPAERRIDSKSEKPLTPPHTSEQRAKAMVRRAARCVYGRRCQLLFPAYAAPRQNILDHGRRSFSAGSANECKVRDPMRSNRGRSDIRANNSYDRACAANCRPLPPQPELARRAREVLRENMLWKIRLARSASKSNPMCIYIQCWRGGAFYLV